MEGSRVNITNRPPLGLKPDKPTAAQIRAGKEYMARVKELPCAACGKPGPSDAHHCICGRFGTNRASDFDTIPLCVECHRYPYPGAIHSGKASWVAVHGPDHGFIPTTRVALSDVELDF